MMVKIGDLRVERVTGGVAIATPHASFLIPPGYTAALGMWAWRASDAAGSASVVFDLQGAVLTLSFDGGWLNVTFETKGGSCMYYWEAPIPQGALEDLAEAITEDDEKEKIGGTD